METSKDSYVVRQEAFRRAYNLKPGDKVRVLRSAHAHKGGWSNVWTDGMDKTIGKVGTLRNVNEHAGGWRVDFEDPACQWAYPYFVLEPVKEDTEAEEDEVDVNCDTCLYEALSTSAHPCSNCCDFDHWTASPTADKGDGGVKHDTDKPRYSLIPTEALDGLARLYTQGAEKYDARNWEKGLAYSRVWDAMQRHGQAWFSRQDYDPADGQHHLLSVMWCAMALYTYQARGMGGVLDDRPEGVIGPDLMMDFWRKSPLAGLAGLVDSTPEHQ